MEEEIIYSNIQAKGCGTNCGWDCVGGIFTTYGNCDTCTCTCSSYEPGGQCSPGYDDSCSGSCA